MIIPTFHLFFYCHSNFLFVRSSVWGFKLTPFKIYIIIFINENENIAEIKYTTSISKILDLILMHSYFVCHLLGVRFTHTIWFCDVITLVSLVLCYFWVGFICHPNVSIFSRWTCRIAIHSCLTGGNYIPGNLFWHNNTDKLLTTTTTTIMWCNNNK